MNFQTNCGQKVALACCCSS